MRNNKAFFLVCMFSIILFLAILNGYFFNWINDTFFNYNNNFENGLKDFSIIEKFIIIIIVGPIIETLIFQYLPNEALEKLKVINKKILIIMPSILFAACHYYKPIYIVMTFFSGILLNTFYIKCKTQTNLYFVLTVLLHSMYNLYGYLFVV